MQDLPLRKSRRSFSPRPPPNSCEYVPALRLTLFLCLQHVGQPRLWQLVRRHRAGARLVWGQPDADHPSALLPGAGTRQPPPQSLFHPTDVIPLHFSPEHPGPSPSHPGPCASFICCFSPRILGAVAASSPGRLLATSIVVSLCCPLGWGTWPWLPDAHSTLA